MKIILVRHGKTIENQIGICQGQTEGTITIEGIRENNALSLSLNKMAIDTFYSSTLLRAKFSMSQIILNHPTKIPFFDNRLIEWGLGDLEGKPFPTHFNILNYKGNIESFESVKKRCISFIYELYLKHSYQTILLVSHGLTIRMLESQLLNIDFMQTQQMKNSSYKILEL
jgi:probable phosphoglycerate mutase